MEIRFFTVLAAALALGACSKSEQASQKPQARIEAAQPAVDATKSQEEIDAGLKERLARQDAAARMFEKGQTEPPPPRAAEPKAPAALKAAEPKAAAPAAPTTPMAPPAPIPAPVATKAPEPVKVPEPAKVEPPKAEPPRAEPPKPAPAEAPKVAAAAPVKAPAQSTAARLVTRVDPEFPREAVQAGVERGNVKVRLLIDEAGAVTRVEVLDATPRRVFDKAVVRALSQWKFNEGAGGRTIDTEVDFRR